MQSSSSVDRVRASRSVGRSGFYTWVKVKPVDSSAAAAYLKSPKCFLASSMDTFRLRACRATTLSVASRCDVGSRGQWADVPVPDSPK